MGYYKVEKLKDDLYCVDLDYSTSNGVLNFTKEITVWIDNKYDFVCAQALTPGGWFDYSKDEKDEFDREWPEAYIDARNGVLLFAYSEEAKRINKNIEEVFNNG